MSAFQPDSRPRPPDEGIELRLGDASLRVKVGAHRPAREHPPAERKKERATDIRSSASPILPPLREGEAVVGTSVRHRTLPYFGSIVSRRPVNGIVEVSVEGGIHVECKVSDLARWDRATRVDVKDGYVSRAGERLARLDLHAFPTREAVRKVERTIQSASAEGFSRLSITCGTGTGAVAQAVKQLLDRESGLTFECYHELNLSASWLFPELKGATYLVILHSRGQRPG